MAVTAALREKKCAVYLIANNHSVNEAMAAGVERAAVFVPLVCSDYQTHRGSSKEFNYADQLKLPMRPVLVQKGFVAKSWLGAALARHTADQVPLEASVPGDAAKIVDELVKSLLKLFPGAIQPEYKPPRISTLQSALYPGGKVKGWYKQPNGVKGDMTLDHFTMASGRVRAQGTDREGSFTCLGSYATSSEPSGRTREVHFVKQYIGKHKLNYKGTYTGSPGDDIVLEGMWEVVPAKQHWRGPFRFDLKVADVGDSEIIRSGSDIVILHHSTQKGVATAMAESLRDRGAKVTVCTNGQPLGDSVLKQCAVAIPIMSAAFQGCAECQKLTEKCDDVGCDFVPVMAQKDWWQSGWLGVIMSGMLWTAFMDGPSMANLKQLCSELHGKCTTVFGLINASLFTDSRGAMSGWYEQSGRKTKMEIDFFEIKEARISGSGVDKIGRFEVNGSHGNDCRFEFRKQYIGKHFVDYFGEMSIKNELVCLAGEWKLKDYGKLKKMYCGRFELLMASQPKKKSASGRHVMISYQWNHQGLVKELHSQLKAEGVPLWFDIAGDMKGNINTAMADGVENAAVICCLVTSAYNESPNCAKEINYATQLGCHILPCKVDACFTPHSWLESCLKGKKIQLLDQENVKAAAGSIIKKILSLWDFKAEEQQTTEKKEEEEVMYEGGTCTGYYVYNNNKKEDMSFSYFTMRNGRVRGQGDDPVGAFTICGTFDKTKMTLQFDKQYVGKHLVKYNGKITGTPGKTLVVDGKWNIPGSWDGPFQLTCK